MITLRIGSSVMLASLLACGGQSTVSPVNQIAADAAIVGDAGAATLRLSANAWRENVRVTLDAFIASPNLGATKRVALFDWDNTMIKNDVGDAMTYWMLKNGKLRAPAGNDWAATSPFLTAVAKARLNAVCGASASTAGLLRTPTNADCTKEILSVYGNAKTTTGVAAFAGHDARRMEPAYAWASALLAGYTESQLSGFADEAIAENELAPVDAKQTLAGVDVAGYTRLYPEMKELVNRLRTAGFDVWVVSASAEPVVRSYAKRAGIDAGHVIGVRAALDNAGLWSAHVQGCGGGAADTAITYIDGKRCWINQVVYGDTTASAWQRRSGVRQVFAAGDSNTDIMFLRDATDLRLVLNRNKEELMCFSYNNEDTRWLVQPMFIGPKAARAALYPCASTACTDSAGGNGACKAESGAVIADQADAVH